MKKVYTCQQCDYTFTAPATTESYRGEVQCCPTCHCTHFRVERDMPVDLEDLEKVPF